MLQHLGIVLRHALGRDPRHGRNRSLDFLDADGLLALVLGHQHLRCAGFVDHVDRLVRQLAVVDVTRRQLHRGLDSLVGVLQLVVVLEIRLEALEDGDGVLDRRFVDVDLLEPAHQSAVLLEVLAVFLVGGRAHAADRARSQSRLEQIRGIHRAAGGGAGTDHCVDFVDEQDGVRVGFELLEHLLQALLEVAAVAGAGQQRAHVEREHGRRSQNLRHFAVDDALGQTFGNRGLADAGFAHEQRIVLLAPAQHLDRAVDLGVTSDHRVDLAVARLLVEVDAIGVERLALLLGLVAALVGLSLLIHTAHRTGFGNARPLGDAVADVVDRVVTRHVLLLQEIGGVAFALGKDRDQHIGARHFFATGRLDVDHCALDHALETGRRLGIVGAIRHQVFEFGLEVIHQAGAQLVEIDAAGPHHRGGVGIIDQRKQQMLKRRILVMTLIRDRKCAVERLFKALRKSWHSASSLAPAIMIVVAASGNKNISHIGTYDRGGRSGSRCSLSLRSRRMPRTRHPQRRLADIRRSSGSNECKTRSYFRDSQQGYFFSITHCKGCWCLRAKSITWVTLVSAIS